MAIAALEKQWSHFHPSLKKVNFLEEKIIQFHDNLVIQDFASYLRTVYRTFILI